MIVASAFAADSLVAGSLPGSLTTAAAGSDEVASASPLFRRATTGRQQRERHRECEERQQAAVAPSGQPTGGLRTVVLHIPPLLSVHGDSGTT